jgi:hypothetical protein
VVGLGGQPDEHPFAGLWGISYTMNLTPDTLTGLGTDQDIFIKTSHGQALGTSRPIMPSMPWPVEHDRRSLKSITHSCARSRLSNQPPAHGSARPMRHRVRTTNVNTNDPTRINLNIGDQQ